jgi:hypothetical protein
MIVRQERHMEIVHLAETTTINPDALMVNKQKEVLQEIDSKRKLTKPISAIMRKRKEALK